MTPALVAIVLLLVLGCLSLIPFAFVLFLAETGLSRCASLPTALMLLMVRSLRRNRMRTSLTFVATFVLVFVVAGLWSVLYFIDQFLTDQDRSPRMIVSEKWQVMSQMPLSYAGSLVTGAARKAGDVKPTDMMTWQIYMGTTDAINPTTDNTVVCIAMEPRKILTMLDDLFTELTTDHGANRDQHDPRRQQQLEESVHRLETTKQGIILGARRLAALNKRVGERFILSGTLFRGIDLEFEIVGVFPTGRYADLGVINRDYLNDSFDAFSRKNGFKHPMESKSLTLVWLQLANQPGCARVAEQIESSGLFTDPAVKSQTLAAAAAAALDAYADLIWWVRWILSPAVLVIMTLVMANAIGISVRERAPEIALLKVLGFRAWQILLLILGEPMLIGAVAGLLSAVLSRLLINEVLNHIAESPIDIPIQALWWSPAAGVLTGLAGSLIPALSACRLKAAQVFSRAI